MRYPDGHPHYRICPDGRVMPVILDDAVRKSCVFLYADDKDGPALLGTAFFVGELDMLSELSYLYLVTARHVIEFARKEYDAKVIKVRMNGLDGSVTWHDMDIDEFLGHPDEYDDKHGAEWLQKQRDCLRVDLMATLFPHGVADAMDTSVWPLTFIVDKPTIDKWNIDAGDDIVVVGLYRNHTGRNRNIPIVRSGVIAAMPEEAVNTALGPSPVYLVEVRSVGGLRGSPVFLLSGSERLMPDGGVDIQRTHKVWLLGVVHGHFDVQEADIWNTAFGRERLNEGIAMVTPADLLPALLHRQEFLERRVPVPINRIENATLDAANAEPAEFDNFKALTRRLLDVPKSEIEG